MVEDRVVVMREGVAMVKALSVARLRWGKNMKLK
jgi:hypothetical protein